jgi:ABC-type metal ion transport system substrate-binding protein
MLSELTMYGKVCGDIIKVTLERLWLLCNRSDKLYEEKVTQSPYVNIIEVTTMRRDSDAIIKVNTVR